ncbi:MAG: hypothetical protein U5L09_02745 [Bacteroidales bacterium]|nr:hypothetical protein [Bacteroidales bacterium]
MGRFTLEDYNGSKEFFVFDKVLSNHKANIETEGTPLMLRVKVTEGKYKDADNNKKYFMNIEEMQFLGDVMNNADTTVIITIDLEQITNTLVQDLHKVVEANPGKHKLQVKVRCPREQIDLEMPGRSKKVDLAGFTKDAGQLHGIKYSLS